MRGREGSSDTEEILAAWQKLTEDVRRSLAQDDLLGVLAALEARERWISAYGNTLSRALAEASRISLREKLLAEEEALRSALEDRRRALLAALEELRTRTRAERSYTAQSREEGGFPSGGLVDHKG
ncbi:MAG: hypothetical protein IMX03_03400 [Brockia lithotrophica]|nr:hypothetical protein [Brockia lithotrophica]